MEDKKTDESVKAGLQVEAGKPDTETQVTQGSIPEDFDKATKEQDADDLVHEQPNEVNEITGEQDIDELVHDSPPSTTIPADDHEERDLDDLVHEADDLGSEQ